MSMPSRNCCAPIKAAGCIMLGSSPVSAASARQLWPTGWRASSCNIPIRQTSRTAPRCSSPPRRLSARRIAARGHADLLVLERQFDLKRERLKSEIVIDDTSEAGQFFARTAGEGGWRICIVDPADDLNIASANALLKLIEEPPSRCLFLLVSHRPGSLLGTIRSRSLRLDLRPLSQSETSAVLTEVGR